MTGIPDITSDTRIRFKRIFDGLMNEKKCTFDMMCYLVAMEIHSLGGNIGKETVKNFYNGINGCKVSTLNQINAWVGSKENME
jgi:hypothetical protein